MWRLQGEVLEQQFGEEEAAFRTLDLYTSAVLEASLAPTKAPKPEWREVMVEMSKVCLILSPPPRVPPPHAPRSIYITIWSTPPGLPLNACQHSTVRPQIMANSPWCSWICI